jgi:hypothetical protein
MQNARTPNLQNETSVISDVNQDLFETEIVRDWDAFVVTLEYHDNWNSTLKN